MASKGIKQIKIPIRVKDLTIQKVEPYLDTIFDLFERNAKCIRDDYDKYCLNHEILTKVRQHEDSEVNSIVLIPDLKAMVDWKTGYVFGNPIKYAQNKKIDTDDITYLNKYVRSVCQRAVDKEVGKWAYATGVGYYFIEPKSENFDIETQSPYEIYCREADTCAKVYSSFGGNKPLFDLLYTTYEEIDKEVMKKTVKVLDIYLPNALYTYEKRDLEKWQLVNTQERGLYKHLPLVEKRPNLDGIGIVAMGESMQNALDRIMSDSLDNVNDVVNETWVYYNILLGKDAKEQAENHRQAKKGGAIQAIAQSKELQPKVETISTKLNLAEVQEVFATLNAKFHSSIGVPMEMSNTNSGGTTKQGSEVANGYDNAYNRALDDINTFIKADTELLEKIMWICKNTPNNKMDNLAVSEIEIKYSLNLTDNILTKTQSFVNLMGVGVPPSIALRLCRLSNDPEAEGKIIEENIARQKKEEATQEKIVVENQGNNSQE
jgi:SPP1 family phage portal protein